jgi:adenylate cyclase
MSDRFFSCLDRNFNYELRYLNLSGNKKLEIKSVGTSPLDTTLGRRLSGFAELQKLKVLGLMDVTLVVTSPPDESDERRVRTSFAEINGMQYGIADTLGCSDTINLFDFAHPRFRSNDDECLFGIFGRAEPLVNSNRVAKFLQENFASTFASSLEKLDTRKNERVEDALRRSFLNLNKSLHEFLVPRLAQGRKLSATAGGTRDRDIKTGASGVVVYITANSSKKTMYVANVGNMLAVVSRASGEPLPVSRKHDPFERDETVRIRAAEGWVSPKGMVNDEVDLSRSFGLYHLLPAVNARPDIHTHELLPDDELVIIGNRGLWDHVSYQTAVDIARSSRHDPMMAAQMLRDFAMGYGADGNTMIMVIDVSQLHQRGLPRTRLPTLDSAADAAELFARPSGPRREGDRTLARLDREVPPPVGQVALVFTDIRNSTVLWETNAGVPVAMALHNELLRRQLRIFGGYTVKTEGDSFMASFPSVASALLWCVSVQMLLLREDWPLEILECDEGREIHGLDGKLLARGLSVRMGIHVGRPVCELDPITDRMDYFGPVVNRASRVSGMAKGGEIMISGDVMNEVVALGILEKSDDEDVNLLDPHADRLRRIGLDVTDQGEKILKGFEAPERLTLVFPKELLGRKNLNVLLSPPTLSSRVHYSVEQMKQLALLCIRLEALASSRVFRDISERPASSTTREKRRSQQVAGAAGSDDDSADEHQPAALMYADARLMMPPITNVATDEDLIVILDSLSTRIENSLATLSMRHMTRLWSSAGDIEKMSLIEELLSMHRG